MALRDFTDQMGRVVSVNYPPRRIISLVPSQTELLFDLGLDKEVVGITKFCIHPSHKFKSTVKVGGTKMLNLQKIRDLKPDLIIGNKEENDRNQIQELANEFPVWMSDIVSLDGAISMITAVGTLTGTEYKANELASKIKESFESLKIVNAEKRTVAYFIWRDPYMVAGRDTFIHDILVKMGFDNFSQLSRYPELTREEIGEFRPDVILLSSEPYPFKDVHVSELNAICPNSKVVVVDGEMFSWYGSRLLQTPSYLQTLKAVIN